MSLVRIDPLRTNLDAALFPIRHPLTFAACVGLAFLARYLKSLVHGLAPDRFRYPASFWVSWGGEFLGITVAAVAASLIFRRLLVPEAPARWGPTEARLYAGLLLEFLPTLAPFILLNALLQPVIGALTPGVLMGLTIAVLVFCLALWSRLFLIAPLTFLQGRLRPGLAWRLTAPPWRRLMLLNLVGLGASFAVRVGWSLLIGNVLGLRGSQPRLLGLSLDELVSAVLSAWQGVMLFAPAALVCRRLAGETRDLAEVFE